MYDVSTGEHVLCTGCLSRDTLSLLAPFVEAALGLYHAGQLPLCTDGRASAGPVDLHAFLNQPSVKEQVGHL